MVDDSIGLTRASVLVRGQHVVWRVEAGQALHPLALALGDLPEKLGFSEHGGPGGLSAAAQASQNDRRVGFRGLASVSARLAYSEPDSDNVYVFPAILAGLTCSSPLGCRGLQTPPVLADSGTVL